MNNKFNFKHLLFTAGCVCVFACGCAQNNGDDAVPTATPTSEPTVTPTIAPTSTPTPTPTPEWTYKIVQEGFYNASATWDEDGNMVDYPEVSDGAEIYYNDFDEYYDNFVYEGNVINSAELFLSDEVYHSGDNSIKVSNRVSRSNGFSGFALTLDDSNAISLDNDVKMTATLDFFALYQDDFGNGVSDSLTFAVWTNCGTLNYGFPKIRELFSLEDGDGLIDIYRNQYNKASNQGYVCIGLFTVEKDTWALCKTTFELCINSTVTDDNGEEVENTATPSIVITTMGDGNSNNVSYYNPFYIDDVVLTIDSIQ